MWSLVGLGLHWSMSVCYLSYFWILFNSALQIFEAHEILELYLWHFHSLWGFLYNSLSSALSTFIASWRDLRKQLFQSGLRWQVTWEMLFWQFTHCAFEVFVRYHTVFFLLSSTSLSQTFLIISFEFFENRTFLPWQLSIAPSVPPKLFLLSTFFLL